MARENAISEYRNVSITFENGVDAQVAAPLDAYKAAVGVVTRLEGEFEKLGAAGVPDMTDKAVLATGSLPFQIHAFEFTTVMATGSYQIVYVETKPNVED